MVIAKKYFADIAVVLSMVFLFPLWTILDSVENSLREKENPDFDRTKNRQVAYLRKHHVYTNIQLVYFKSCNSLLTLTCTQTLQNSTDYGVLLLLPKKNYCLSFYQ